MKRLIVALVFAIFVAVFALQNNRPFAIKFLFWTFPRLSEALVIIASVLLGVILGALLAWREHLRQGRLKVEPDAVPSTPPPPTGEKL